MEEIFNILHENDKFDIEVHMNMIEACAVTAAIKTLQDNSSNLKNNKVLNSAKEKIYKALEDKGNGQKK